MANYEITSRLGRGKYSDVFEGIDLRSNAKCVIKVLKPVRPKKIRREIKILQNILNGANIISLLDVVYEPNSKCTSLITEFVDDVSYKVLYRSFSLTDIQYYIFQLLKALHHCHSEGIIHRDIKPNNVMIDHPKRKLRLIDWGLAEFYHPGQELNARVSTRPYKPPELLLNFLEYDYSLDIWSLGCMFAGMIFKKDPFFQSQSNHEQMLVIASILGSVGLMSYIEKYCIVIRHSDDVKIDRIPKNLEPRNLIEFIDDDNRHLVSHDGLDLLGNLLRYDHQTRLTAEEAMAHSFFDPVRLWDASA